MMEGGGRVVANASQNALEIKKTIDSLNAVSNHTEALVAQLWQSHKKEILMLENPCLVCHVMAMFR